MFVLLNKVIRYFENVMLNNNDVKVDKLFVIIKRYLGGER